MLYASTGQSLFILFGIFGHLVDFCKAETPRNPLYQTHPSEVTMVYNYTLFVLPYPKAEAEDLAKPYPLLSPGVKTANETAPVLVQFGRDTDIRFNFIETGPLMTATVSVPFVDRTRNNKSPFSLAKYSFQDSLFTSTVSTLEGYRNEIAVFEPAHEAYGTNQGVSSFKVLPKIGSTSKLPVFEAAWFPLPVSETPEYSLDDYKGLTSGPIFGWGLGCGTITSFYNYTFTKPTFVLGNVTLYGSSDDGHFPRTMQFNNVHGLSVTVAKSEHTFPPLNCNQLA